MKNRPEIHKRIWGQEEWIINKWYCGKRMQIKPGFYSSYHKHDVKYETFYVAEGVLELIYQGEHLVLERGESLNIDAGEYHSFRALEETVFFEFSTHHEDSDTHRLTQSSFGNHEQWEQEIMDVMKDE